MEWRVRPDQLSAQSAAGTFALKLVEIVDLVVHAYYAMRTPAQGPPAVTAPQYDGSPAQAGSARSRGIGAVIRPTR